MKWQSLFNKLNCLNKRKQRQATFQIKNFNDTALHIIIDTDDEEIKVKECKVEKILKNTESFVVKFYIILFLILVYTVLTITFSPCNVILRIGITLIMSIIIIGFIIYVAINNIKPVCNTLKELSTKFDSQKSKKSYLSAVIDIKNDFQIIIMLVYITICSLMLIFLSVLFLISFENGGDFGSVITSIFSTTGTIKIIYKIADVRAKIYKLVCTYFDVDFHTYL